MKIVNKCLIETLAELCSNQKNELPFDNAKRPYIERFREISAKLDRDFHSHVQAGSSAVDGGILTDHGPDHISTVIRRASAILDNPKNTYCLNGYEIYLLICAIHFHDLGNIHGREGHETRIAQMMEHVDQYLGDSIEKSIIRQIATVHGGKVNDNMDTIFHIASSEPINGMDVRPRMLAAILRFADELADDHLRANNALEKIKAIPKQSEIFHKYASCLHSVIVREDCQTVELSYTVPTIDLIKTFPKLNKKTGRYVGVYIVDEILERLFKMYNERTYCNRFMNPVVNIQSISVSIKAVRVNQPISERLPEISFRLEETGYPSGNFEEIYSLSGDLESWGSSKKRFSGIAVSKAVRQMMEPVS